MITWYSNYVENDANPSSDLENDDYVPFPFWQPQKIEERCRHSIRYFLDFQVLFRWSSVDHASISAPQDTTTTSEWRRAKIHRQPRLTPCLNSLIGLNLPCSITNTFRISTTTITRNTSSNSSKSRCIPTSFLPILAWVVSRTTTATHTTTIATSPPTLAAGAEAWVERRPVVRLHTTPTVMPSITTMFPRPLSRLHLAHPRIA